MPQAKKVAGQGRRLVMWARRLALGCLMVGALIYLSLASSGSMLTAGSLLGPGGAVRANRTLREEVFYSRITIEEEIMFRPEEQQSNSSKYKRCRGPNGTLTVPQVQTVHSWHSYKPRQRESVTVVTQLSLERVRMLKNQCKVWPDPIAAVVYVPTVKGHITATKDKALLGKKLQLAVAHLEEFFLSMEHYGSCILDLELITQDFSSEEEAGLYPINAARNRALMLARSDVVLLLDADFVPSPTIVPEYKSHEAYAALLKQLSGPEAIVLPAFEVSGAVPGKRIAMAAAWGGRQYALMAYQHGALKQFQGRQFAKGHRPTNYSRWAAEDQPYRIQYVKDYEPYVLLARQFAPWYDERFTGFGRNKIQYIRHLDGLNFKFSVHPRGFVVHVPHAHSLTHQLTRSTQHWTQMHKLFVRIDQEIRQQSFVPVVGSDKRCGLQ